MATGNAAEWRALISTSAMRLVKKYAFGMFIARKHSATCAGGMQVRLTTREILYNHRLEDSTLIMAQPSTPAWAYNKYIAGIFKPVQFLQTRNLSGFAQGRKWPCASLNKSPAHV